MFEDYSAPAFAIPLIFESSSQRQIAIDKFDVLNVECRPLISGYMGNQPFFQKYVDKIPVAQNAEELTWKSMYVSNDPALSDLELDYLIECINKCERTSLW